MEEFYIWKFTESKQFLDSIPGKSQSLFYYSERKATMGSTCMARLVGT